MDMCTTPAIKDLARSEPMRITDSRWPRLRLDQAFQALRVGEPLSVVSLDPTLGCMPLPLFLAELAERGHGLAPCGVDHDALVETFLRARKAARLTQSKLGELARSCAATVAKLEVGGAVQVRTAVRIARALELELVVFTEPAALDRFKLQERAARIVDAFVAGLARGDSRSLTDERQNQLQADALGDGIVRLTWWAPAPEGLEGLEIRGGYELLRRGPEAWAPRPFTDARGGLIFGHCSGGTWSERHDLAAVTAEASERIAAIWDGPIEDWAAEIAGVSIVERHRPHARGAEDSGGSTAEDEEVARASTVEPDRADERKGGPPDRGVGRILLEGVTQVFQEWLTEQTRDSEQPHGSDAPHPGNSGRETTRLDPDDVEACRDFGLFPIETLITRLVAISDDDALALLACQDVLLAMHRSSLQLATKLVRFRAGIDLAVDYTTLPRIHREIWYRFLLARGDEGVELSPALLAVQASIDVSRAINPRDFKEIPDVIYESLHTIFDRIADYFQNHAC